jgi:hypothetical protein
MYVDVLLVVQYTQLVSVTVSDQCHVANYVSRSCTATTNYRDYQRATLLI